MAKFPYKVTCAHGITGTWDRSIDGVEECQVCQNYTSAFQPQLKSESSNSVGDSDSPKVSLKTSEETFALCSQIIALQQQLTTIFSKIPDTAPYTAVGVYPSEHLRSMNASFANLHKQVLDFYIAASSAEMNMMRSTAPTGSNTTTLT